MHKRRKKVKFRRIRWGTKLLVLYVIALFAVNTYHHPGILLTPISGFFNKTPQETWESYKEDFLEYSSTSVSPSFLAALAQTESMGNPLALTDWQARWDYNPLLWFRPSSTATGLFQVTTSTWDQYKKYCWQKEQVLEDKKEVRCFNNPIRFRFSGKDSIYLASAWFHEKLKDTSISQTKYRESFLSVLHLCGLEKAKTFYRSNFSWQSIGSCGSHNPRGYFNKVQKNKSIISRYQKSTDQPKLAQIGF